MNSLLVIGKVWPEPASSAAGTRMLQLLGAFSSMGYRITFATAAGHTGYDTPLQDLGIETAGIQLNDSSFDDFVKMVNPRVVMFDRFTSEEQFGWRVSQHCPDALRILDSEDLHFIRHEREQKLRQSLGQRIKPVNDVALREMASIYRSDLTLVISSVEMDRLHKLSVPPSQLLYLPYLYESLREEDVPGLESRQDFVFAGNYLHAPNLDAVLLLHREIWPLIRKQRPQSRINVYGAYAPKEIMALHNQANGFLVHGRANNIMQVYRQARVNLAPLRFGAGLKGKLVEGMRGGLPAVATTIAAEGLNENEKSWCGLIADDPQAFADAAVRLYTDEALWTQASKAGIEIHNQLFNAQHHTAHLNEKIGSLLENLQLHRAANLFGSVLQHQQYQAARYMSLYIETKNKLQNKED